MGAFDLREVKVANETLHIRPIEWEVPDDQIDVEETRPIKYESSDPITGQRIEIMAEDIAFDGTVIRSIDHSGEIIQYEEASKFNVEAESVPLPAINSELIEQLNDAPVGLEIKVDGSAVAGTQQTDTRTMVEQVVPDKTGLRRRRKRQHDENCPFQDPVTAGELRPAS
jgi:hypothetical protein